MTRMMFLWLLLLSCVPENSWASGVASPSDTTVASAATPTEQPTKPRTRQALWLGVGLSGGVGYFGTERQIPWDVGILSPELRIPTRRGALRSVDLKWDWSKLVSPSPIYQRSPLVAFTTFLRFGTGPQTRTRFVFSPGVRTGIGFRLYTGSYKRIYALIGLVLRIGVELESPEGRARHGIYLRPQFDLSGGLPLPTVGLEYTATWRIPRRRPKPVASLASTALPDDLKPGKPQPPATRRPMELGFGMLAGVNAIPFPYIWEHGVASPELRFYPHPGKDQSVDLQINWSKAVQPLWAGARQVDVAAFAHYRLKERGRTNLALAGGGRVSVGSQRQMHGIQTLSTMVVGAGRFGVDIRSPEGSADHGVYLRPELGLHFSPVTFIFFPHAGLAVEYTVVWRLKKGRS